MGYFVIPRNPTGAAPTHDDLLARMGTLGYESDVARGLIESQRQEDERLHPPLMTGAVPSYPSAMQ